MDSTPLPPTTFPSDSQHRYFQCARTSFLCFLTNNFREYNFFSFTGCHVILARPAHGSCKRLYHYWSRIMKHTCHARKIQFRISAKLYLFEGIQNAFICWRTHVYVSAAIEAVTEGLQDIFSIYVHNTGKPICLHSIIIIQELG